MKLGKLLAIGAIIGAVYWRSKGAPGAKEIIGPDEPERPIPQRPEMVIRMVPTYDRESVIAGAFVIHHQIRLAKFRVNNDYNLSQTASLIQRAYSGEGGSGEGAIVIEDYRSPIGNWTVTKDQKQQWVEMLSSLGVDPNNVYWRTTQDLDDGLFSMDGAKRS